MRKVFLLGTMIVFAGAAMAQGAPASQNPTAIIKTTDGNFTCELFKDKVPNAVDNFIALAKGTKDWRDPDTHAKKHGKPLYDGTTFHRVIPQFMIQGGDPAGTGAGEVGVKINDEYSPDLKFDKPGVLAYANSGRNTNGSQFFITEVATPDLDPCLDTAGCTRFGRFQTKGYGYTIFGECTPVSLVAQIARTPRDANDKPYRPVKIIHIQILRPGETPGAAKPTAPAHKTAAPAHKPAAKQ
jgi:peptidyl-prolyl cis-trans isomerase A (cyclophilin A)